MLFSFFYDFLSSVDAHLQQIRTFVRLKYKYYYEGRFAGFLYCLLYLPWRSNYQRYNIMWSSLSVTCDRSVGTPVSSTNKTYRHDITKILLKVVLNTINQTKPSHHRLVDITIDQFKSATFCVIPKTELGHGFYCSQWFEFRGGCSRLGDHHLSFHNNTCADRFLSCPCAFITTCGCYVAVCQLVSIVTSVGEFISICKTILVISCSIFKDNFRTCNNCKFNNKNNLIYGLFPFIWLEF